MGALCLSTLHAQTDESAALEQIRATYNLPGLSAIAVKKGRIVAQGAAGVRRVGNPSPLRVTDRLNFASCTKFMTATVAARLVDKGQMEWNKKIRDVFPAYATFNAAFPDQTLDDLLAHRAGVEEQVTFDSRHWNAFQAVNGNLTELRSWVCDQVLRDPPDVSHGTYLYSNLGYTVAARMMEIVTGKSWEQLVEEEIYRPLRLANASMGISYTDDAVPPGPVGHDLDNGSTVAVPRPVPSAAFMAHYQASNAAGGFVLCTLADYAKFLHAHVAGENSAYLSFLSQTRLTAPWAGVEGYGRGVFSVRRSWAEPGPALNHSGDIFGEDTVFWAAPAWDFAVVVFTNCRSADDRVFYGLDAAAWRLISTYLSPPETGPCLEAPQVTALTKAGETLSIKVQTLPTVRYQLQRISDLQTGGWSNDGDPLEAADWNTTFSPHSSLPKEFFRITTSP